MWELFKMGEHKELYQYLSWAPALRQRQRTVRSAGATEANQVESMQPKKQKDSHVCIYRGIFPLSPAHI